VKKLSKFCLQHCWKSIAASILWLLILFFFGHVDRWSVCGLCGAKRFESELTLAPFPIALLRNVRVEPTPLSQFVQNRNPQSQCPHDWLFASSCRGAAAALAHGPGIYVFSAAIYPESTNLLFVVEQFLGSAARDEWIHRALTPDTAKQFELLAVYIPQDGFSSADRFTNWLMENERKTAADTMRSR